MAILCAELGKCSTLDEVWMRDNKNGPKGATDMLAVMVAYYMQRRRLITIIHSEGDVIVDDPRISIIPRHIRLQGFDLSYKWLNNHPCLKNLHRSRHTHSLSFIVQLPCDNPIC